MLTMITTALITRPISSILTCVFAAWARAAWDRPSEVPWIVVRRLSSLSTFSLSVPIVEAY